MSWCEVTFHLVPELPEALEMPVGGVTIPVVPLTMLVAADRDVSDVFRAVQAVLAG